MIRRAILGILIIPALVAGMMVGVARAQSPQPDEAQIPSITVHPEGTNPSDPQGGQWFIVNLEPKVAQKLQVRLYNPADVAQVVKLYLADAQFDANGLPEVSNTSRDVGTWGTFENPDITLAPHETQIQSFTLTAPRGVDPGDHIGAVVAEHAPQGSGAIRSVKRVAVRLYATLPGDARRDFAIDAVSTQRDSTLFTRRLDVTVQLRNTGRVRLETAVQVGGRAAKGSTLLMSNSVERYHAMHSVPLWGGPVRLAVDAESRSLGLPGPTRQLRVTVWVIPWYLFVLVLLLAGLGFAINTLLRRRRGRYESLQSDMRRIERLVSQQMRGGASAPAPALGTGPAPDQHAHIVEAIKQARRAGDHVTAERLEQALRERRAAYLSSTSPRSD